MKMNVRKKLIASFTVVLFLIAIITGITYIEFDQVNSDYSTAIKDRLKKISLTSDIVDSIYREQSGIRGYLASQADSNFNSYNEAAVEFQQAVAEFMELDLDSSGKDMLNLIITYEEQYRQIAGQLIELKKQDKTVEYTELMNTDGATVVAELNSKADELLTHQEDGLYQSNTKLTQKVDVVKNLVLAISIFAIIIGLVIALIVGRIISLPVKLVSEAADQIAKGNLRLEKLNVKSKDEIGQLSNSFNIMGENLRNLIQQVSLTSEQVAASAEELMASAEQTNSATVQVATSIETVAGGAENLNSHADDTASTIKDMADSIETVAHTTSTVAQSALEMIQQANVGREYIQKVIEQMQSIHDSSNATNVVIKDLDYRSGQIGSIIEVITGIAEQTNLLALNAAIESARAGEHGRGFAVVADEVRKLAEQSRASASQIAGLVQGIQADTLKVVDMMNKEISEVTEGMELVGETGKTFEIIVKSIEVVSSEIQEVSAISEEISASAEMVNTSVAEVAEIAKASAGSTAEIAAATEEQLASMEEISASASSLAHMSEELSNTIRIFKI